MQQTFQVNASDLDNRFIKSVKDIFGDRKFANLAGIQLENWIDN